MENLKEIKEVLDEVLDGLITEMYPGMSREAGAKVMGLFLGSLVLTEDEAGAMEYVGREAAEALKRQEPWAVEVCRISLAREMPKWIEVYNNARSNRQDPATVISVTYDKTMAEAKEIVALVKADLKAGPVKDKVLDSEEDPAQED